MLGDLVEVAEDLGADLVGAVLEEAAEKCQAKPSDAPNGTNFNWFRLKKVSIILMPIWPTLILGMNDVVISRNFSIISIH